MVVGEIKMNKGQGYPLGIGTRLKTGYRMHANTTHLKRIITYLSIVGAMNKQRIKEDACVGDYVNDALLFLRSLGLIKYYKKKNMIVYELIEKQLEGTKYT